jgi:thiazole synthase
VSAGTEGGVEDFLEIAGKRFKSRLMMGTGKWRTAEEMNSAFEHGRTEIITVAIRRLDLDDPTRRTLLDEIDWTRYAVLPNTAGCYTADEAVRIARLGRAVTGSDWVKLEVIGDPKYLLPDMDGTLEAARRLVDDGFVVLPYIMDDPVLALKLQEIGTATVMPLGSPIGSGQGMPHFERIRVIIEQARVPVVVDAGLGAPSDAAIAMEIGADAVLVNTAIAKASNPVLMAEAFAQGVEAGRKAFLAGRIPRLAFAEASSPVQGVVR